MREPGTVIKVSVTGWSYLVNATFCAMLGDGPLQMPMGIDITEGLTGWTDHGYTTLRAMVGRGMLVNIERWDHLTIGYSEAEVEQETMPYCLTWELPVVLVRTRRLAPALTSASAESCA